MELEGTDRVTPTATAHVDLGPEIADGCLARLDSPHRFEAVNVSLDQEYLGHLDAALAAVATQEDRLAEREPGPPPLRSAAAEVLVAEALGGRAGHHRFERGAGIRKALAGDLSNVVLDGVERRLDPLPRPEHTPVELLLSPGTRHHLDAELRYLVEAYLHPADQPHYRGDGFPDLRSAFVEAVLVTWLIWSAPPASGSECGG